MNEVKKILIINASPRPGGNIATALGAMEAEARDRGHSVTTIDISGLSVKPCTGCMSCRTEGECCLPTDDAQRVVSLLRCSDVLIVGAPTYWGNMPGPLKTLFDRMVYALMAEGTGLRPVPLMKGKRAIILTTCNTPWPFNILTNQSRGCLQAISEVLRWGGFKIVKKLGFGGMRRTPLTPRQILKARRSVPVL